MRLEGHGIAADLPSGWEGAIAVDRSPDAVALADAGGQLRPTTHLATFGLPAVRGDFGSGAVEQMIDGDVLICLLEESAQAAGSSLHGTAGIPEVTSGDFSPDAMQRPLRGQSGTQAFFHAAGRAFVLYVVLGGHASRAARVGAVNDVLAGIELDPG